MMKRLAYLLALLGAGVVYAAACRAYSRRQATGRYCERVRACYPSLFTSSAARTWMN